VGKCIEYVRLISVFLIVSLSPAPASTWKKEVTQEQKQFNSEVTKKGFLAYFVKSKKSKTLLKS